MFAHPSAASRYYINHVLFPILIVTIENSREAKNPGGWERGGGGEMTSITRKDFNGSLYYFGTSEMLIPYDHLRTLYI